MDMMRISQLATRSGIPASTLRFYDSAGLFAGRPHRGRYRLYGEEAVERLGLISTAKHLGLPLEEIGDLLAVWETGSCAQVKADLQSRITARLAQAAQRAAEIKAFTAALRGALEHVQALPGPGSPLRPRLRSPRDSAGAPLDSCDPHTAGTLLAARASGGAWHPWHAHCPCRDLPSRAAAWRAATSGATAAAIPDGMRLTLPAGRATTLAGLATAEQDCCPFLDFRLHLDSPVLHLEVRAPSDAADLLAALFTPDRPHATPAPILLSSCQPWEPFF